MKRSRLNFARVSAARAAVVTILLTYGASFGKTDVPVFLLSGQSNMVGYFSAVSDLTADQKKTIENVKINMNSDGDKSKFGKWLPLGTGFGATASNIGPELAFGRTLSDSMPGVKIALIKDAVGGTYLGKTEGWLPPGSNSGNGGTLYNNMMNHIDAALKSFATAFDTTQYTPRWAGFIWLQGEFDAREQMYTDAYEKNLTNLINDIRAEVNITDLPVILPMIDAQNQWTYNAKVRAADVALKQKLKNVDTMDTKGLPTDGTHYKAAGYLTIGRVCAQRWLDMRFRYGDKVSTVYRYGQHTAPESFQISSHCQINAFDLSGRMSGSSDGGTVHSRTTFRSPLNSGIVVLQFNQPGRNATAVLRVVNP